MVTSDGACSLRALLANAHAAYLGWRETAAAERVSLFRRFVEVYPRTPRNSPGWRPRKWARSSDNLGSKPASSSRCSSTTPIAEELFADEEISVPGVSRAVTRREPVGVVLGIESWIGPLCGDLPGARPLQAMTLLDRATDRVTARMWWLPLLTGIGWVIVSSSSSGSTTRA
jgi:hypothetical protein